MSEPVTIDVKMHGIEGLTGAFVVTGDKTALVETGPKSSVENVQRGLAEAGVARLDYIVVTHVHLDHAGAAGTLAHLWPDAVVAVHEVGAPHLVDPTKLWASAVRIFGRDMDRLWGGIDPIPAERVRALVDGDRIDLGGRVLRALDTPGHAYHHHAFLDDATGILFAGDALGVRLQDVGFIRPATPPPEFDLEAAIGSIARIRDLGPSSVWLTHFGPAASAVPDICEEATASLRNWARWVADARAAADDLDEVTALVAKRARGELEERLSEDQIRRLEETTSYRMNTWGYMRYMDRRHGDASQRSSLQKTKDARS
jgi:glyoxylase-like metal-dependent hydrolase (beta-lactamase superfamily II)